MTPTFIRAVRYEAEAVCQSPLHTGSPDGQTETVLRNREGRAFVQGASLAGALRDWCARFAGAEKTARLFGEPSRGGHLVVSDAIFDADAETAVRPHLRIDGRTGTASPGGKFDMAHICPGARFRFTLTWLGGETDGGELDALEAALGALDAGEICLGAQKTNGFGKVKLHVVRRTFDLRRAADREAWLRDETGGETVKLTAPCGPKETVFTVSGRVGHLLVQAGSRTYAGDGQTSWQGNLEENGRPILPASSIRGAVRARVSAIADRLGLGDAEIQALFGGTEGPGAARFEDVLLGEERRQIVRIRIDRFTGSIIRQKLAAREPLCGAVRFQIALRDASPASCALLAYALRDLGLGLYYLGSEGSVGWGYLRVSAIDLDAPGDGQAQLRFDPEKGCTASDPDGILARWTAALKKGDERI